LRAKGANFWKGWKGSPVRTKRTSKVQAGSAVSARARLLHAAAAAPCWIEPPAAEFAHALAKRS
jgi:hypothetical protein